ncbi:MAG: RDD family protein, partial [Actinomycetota bacterium]
IVVLMSIVSQAGADGGAGFTTEDGDRLYSAGLVTLAISALYEISLTALRGQTLGKMALGIKVVPAEGAGSVGWGWSAIRWLTPNAAARLPGVGALLSPLVRVWMLWDPRRQGLHDKAARTLVIRSR